MAENPDFPYVARITNTQQPATTEEESKEAPAQQALVVQVVGGDRRTRKNMLVNTSHCRAELDTV